MTKKMIKTTLSVTGDEMNRQVEEAAYYSWLNRGRYAQVGDELGDWLDAEKEVRSNLP